METKLTESKNIVATKEDILKLHIDIEKRFNHQNIWIVATTTALAGTVIAAMKL